MQTPTHSAKPQLRQSLDNSRTSRAHSSMAQETETRTRLGQVGGARPGQAQDKAVKKGHTPWPRLSWAARFFPKREPTVNFWGNRKTPFARAAVETLLRPLKGWHDSRESKQEGPSWMPCSHTNLGSQKKVFCGHAPVG